METIYRYIVEKLLSPENALGQYNRIADEILSLDVFPGRCRLVDFEPERSQGLRRLLVDNYSVFYVVRGNQVIVTDVLYSASDIERRLKERRSQGDSGALLSSEQVGGRIDKGLKVLNFDYSIKIQNFLSLFQAFCFCGSYI